MRTFVLPDMCQTSGIHFSNVTSIVNAHREVKINGTRVVHRIQTILRPASDPDGLVLCGKIKVTAALYIKNTAYIFILEDVSLR